MYEVRVRGDFRYNHVRVAGREFNKNRVALLADHELTDEIRESPLLEVARVPEAAPEVDAVDATNAARALAAELGIDLATVTGTGEEGRILQADVEAVKGSGDDQE